MSSGLLQGQVAMHLTSQLIPAILNGKPKTCCDKWILVILNLRIIHFIAVINKPGFIKVSMRVYQKYLNRVFFKSKLMQNNLILTKDPSILQWHGWQPVLESPQWLSWQRSHFCPITPIWHWQFPKASQAWDVDPSKSHPQGTQSFVSGSRKWFSAHS